MNHSSLARFSLSPALARALTSGTGVVALESTVIAHGLPAPHNLELARECESIVQEQGAAPATIGIIAGHPVIGLDEAQLQEMASRQDVAKVNLSNLAQTLAGQKWGATTVAATLCLAHRAGLQVFATGGIGGVHRGASNSFDISADLTALSRFPVITVCAGAKAILDLPKTMEMLETLGVPVIGYQTDELPAFYSRKSGIKLDIRADDPFQVATLAQTHWELGNTGAILVVAPVPETDQIPADEIAEVIEEALSAADSQGISGKAVTPFLLARIAEKTAGRSLQANLALLKNNARIAAQIAKAMVE
ncbi:MAG: pseudouridine-5'-phosphate glycosidase [Acidobacteria bacterium]|nr:pseudouridine-5'-phosphate glycosidase [Acidobacteriota bacterium]